MVGYEYAGIAYEKQGEMLAARRRHYVELVLAGMGYAEAARAVGVSKRTGKVWRNGRTRSTGRNEAPCAEWTEAAMPQPKPTGPRYLSMDERIFIADGLVCGLSMSAIASRLGRSRSTVCREVARNRDRGTGRYTPYRAGEMAAARRRRPKPRKLEDRRLAAAVQAKLDVHWSPEQISHWLAAEYPDNEGMNASTETIYQAIYIQAKGQLKRNISQQLRSGRTARRPRTAPDARKPRFREPMVMISERPPEVEDRAVPGHWEGDLITGAANKSAIGTLVERSSRNVILLHLPDGHGSGKVQEAVGQEDGEASQAYAKLADVGPGLGDGAARQDIGGAGHGRLLLRPALAMAARRQREHERPAAAVLPEGHRPEHLPRGVPGRRRRGTQRQAPQDARVEEAQRGVPGVDKRFADSLKSAVLR